MNRGAIGPLEALFFLIMLVAAARAQEIPDLREENPKGELRGDVSAWGRRPANPAAPLEVDRYPAQRQAQHKIVAPLPRPTPTPTPPPQGGNELSRVIEKVRFLSTIQAAPWGGARWRGKGTGASDGGLAISGTLPNGVKPTLLIGPRSLGGALGYSRIFAGGEVASGKVFAVVGYEPLTW